MESPYKSLAFLTVEPSLDATREDLEEFDNTADQVQFLMKMKTIKSSVGDCTQWIWSSFYFDVFSSNN